MDSRCPWIYIVVGEEFWWGENVVQARVKSSLRNQNLDGEFSDQWCLFLINTLWTLFNCSKKFFLLLFFSFLIFFFRMEAVHVPVMSQRLLVNGFSTLFWEKIIWFLHLTPHSFPNKKINNLFWSKFLFSYTYYMEPACFITLFHVWPQVLVQILSWWEVCLLAMISLVSKAWSSLSFANDSLKNTATFYVNNYFIDWLMNVYYFSH